MKNKNKVGLILAFKSTNYGAQLQAYATQVVLESLGVQTEIIDYSPKRGDRHVVLSKGIIHFLYHKYLFRKRYKKRTESKDPLFLKSIKERKEQSSLFINRCLHNIKEIKGYTRLLASTKDYDAVLIGSDQQWIPGFSFGNCKSLQFVPDNVRRISYATSLGVSEYPKYCWSTARKAWNRIDYLSVREKQGADIIKQVCGPDTRVQVVVDPTYLLTKQEWEKILPVERKKDEKYVFCYFLGNDDTSKQIARRFADDNQLKLVSVLSTESYSTYDQSFADELVLAGSPEDFVNWIRGAEYVFTDSFHGTAFSVINEKQVFVFYRKRTETASRNSRIDNILEKWGISERLILPGVIDMDYASIKDINYDKVNYLVDVERKKSLQFLKDAMRFDENK